MQFDAFTGGVEPGGLRSQSDIRLLIWYMLANGALNLLARAKRERENKVSIDKHGNGYHVTCHISGGKGDLMTITLYAPDLYQARVIKKNFHRNPEAVYQALMSLMTGNKDYLETVVREL